MNRLRQSYRQDATTFILQKRNMPLTEETRFTDSILFLLISLTSIAATLYLPQHVSLLASRAWYYINGETIDIAAFARNVFDGALGAGKGAAAVVREL